MGMNLADKHESLQGILKELSRVVVAYSGGVDSTFLLKAAVDTLGAGNVLACMSVGPSEPSHLLERAGSVARSLGVEMMTVEAEELDDPNFKANNADRCFHCKSHLCRTLAGRREAAGLRARGLRHQSSTTWTISGLATRR